MKLNIYTLHNALIISRKVDSQLDAEDKDIGVPSSTRCEVWDIDGQGKEIMIGERKLNSKNISWLC